MNHTNRAQTYFPEPQIGLLIFLYIQEVVYNAHYPLGEQSIVLLKDAGVQVRQTELNGNF